MSYYELLVDLLWRLHHMDFKSVEVTISDRISHHPIPNLDKFEVFWTISGISKCIHFTFLPFESHKCMFIALNSRPFPGTFVSVNLFIYYEWEQKPFELQHILKRLIHLGLRKEY
jgi:hypothetical protein